VANRRVSVWKYVKVCKNWRYQVNDSHDGIGHSYSSGSSAHVRCAAFVSPARRKAVSLQPKAVVFLATENPFHRDTAQKPTGNPGPEHGDRPLRRPN
jgi:hypothetical protein